MDGDTGLGRQGRGDIVLRRQRIRRCKLHLSAAGRESADQDCGLGRNVQARGDPQSCERLLGGERGPQHAKHRHGALGPGDTGLASQREPGIGDV